MFSSCRAETGCLLEPSPAFDGSPVVAAMGGFVGVEVDASVAGHSAGRMPECLQQLAMTDEGMLLHPSMHHVTAVCKLGFTLLKSALKGGGSQVGTPSAIAARCSFFTASAFLRISRNACHWNSTKFHL